MPRSTSGVPPTKTHGPRKQHKARSDADHDRDPSFFNQKNDLASAVLATVGAVIMVLDSKGRIVEFNQASEALTGYCFEEVWGRYV